MKLIPQILIFSLCLLFEIVNVSAASAQNDSRMSVGKNINSQASEKSDGQQSLGDLIHFGDLIEIDVIGSVEYDWRGKLNPEGFLSGITYLEEPIYALCRSEGILASEIASRYSKFLANPEVVVRILDKSGRPVAILNGAVKTPSKFQIQRQVRLNELVINAGGLSENASGEIEILRNSGSDCSAAVASQSTNAESKASESGKETRTLNIKIADLISGVENANPYILSGDYITVKKAQPIYIVGNIIEPRRLDSRENLTVSRAVAAAGGFAKNSDLNKILIYRLTEGSTKVIEVNFQSLREDDENDIKLQPLDVVEVLIKGGKKRMLAPIIETEDIKVRNISLPLKVIS